MENNSDSQLNNENVTMEGEKNFEVDTDVDLGNNIIEMSSPIKTNHREEKFQYLQPQEEERLKQKKEIEYSGELSDEENSRSESSEQPQQPQQPQQQEQNNQPEQQSLLERLASYSIVNTAYTTYGNIKNYNSILNAGLSAAENTTVAAIAYTTPVILPRVQPIYNALDERFHVEEAGNQLLDIVEAKVANANETISYIQTKKNNAQDLVLGLPHKSYEVFVDRPLEQILEGLETFLDKILPPNITEKLENDEELSKSTRLFAIGKGVPKRVVNLAQLKLTDEQLQSFTFLVDLIQYITETIDSQSKKALNNATAIVTDGKHKIEDKIYGISDTLKTNTENISTQYISPIKTAIEERLSGIKEVEIRNYVAISGSIAHAAELAKRQLFVKLEGTQNLIAELQTYLDSSLKAVKAFDKNQLPVYLQNMEVNAVQALTTILSLISTYTPAELLHKLSFANFNQNLENWRSTLEQRLASIEASNKANRESEKNNETVGQVS